MNKLIAFFAALRAKLMRKHDEESEQPFAFALRGESDERRSPRYHYTKRHRIRIDRAQLDLFFSLAPQAEQITGIQPQGDRKLPRLIELAQIGGALGLTYHGIAPAPLNYRGRISGL